MDTDIYMKGFRLTFENAKRLFVAAEVLEKTKEFAIANSLLVLSAEEGMKAYTVLTQHHFPEKILEDFDKSFQDHKHKLETIRSLTSISQIMQKFYELITEPIIENIEKSVEEISKVKSQGVKDTVKWLESQIDSNGKETDMAKQNRWWKQAKTLKENGFYVGFNKGQWITPSSTKKQNYLITKEYVGDFIEQLEVLYTVDLNNPMIAKMITEMKLKIKDFEK